MTYILQARNLRKSYHSEHIKVEALKSASFDLAVGSMNVIVGRSGSGKSTLLKVLGGLIKPDAGKVLIGEQSIYEISETQRARLRSQQLGFVFQEFNLINELSVINNIRLPYDINGMTYNKPAESEIIGMLNLENRLRFYPEQLSGGERQRTAIARALLTKPLLILADEPTGNLDSETGKSMMNFFQESNRCLGQSFLIVTHDQDWCKIAHHVFRMNDGNLIQEY